MLASHFELYAVASSSLPAKPSANTSMVDDEALVMHALFNGTPAHPYMPPSAHDVDTFEYATVRLSTLQAIQVEAYKQLRKKEAEVFLKDIDLPFAIVKEDERWLRITRWRERSAALLSQCEGEKSGTIVTIDASGAFDTTLHHLHGFTNNGSPHIDEREGSPASSQKMKLSKKVFTVGIQEEDARVEIYRNWVIEYRTVLPLQKRFLKMKREQCDAVFKVEESRRSHAAWLDSVVLDHVNAQEVVLREEARGRELLHTRGLVWQRRLLDQSASGASLIRVQREYEPDMRAALAYSEVLSRSQLDTSRGVLASWATLKTSTHNHQISKKPDCDVVYYSSFDRRANLWANGGGSADDALLRVVADESMEREFAVIEESCQRQYVLMMLFRDLQFTKWISEKLHSEPNRILPVTDLSSSSRRPPLPVAPPAQPL